MKHLAQTIFETPKVWRKGNPWVTQNIVSIKGLALFEAAIADSRGTILVIPHQGNWEVLGLWAGQHKAMTSLYDPPRMRALENWIKTSRQQSGATLVPTNVRGVAAIIKALKRGRSPVFCLTNNRPREWRVRHSTWRSDTHHDTDQ